MKHLAAAVAAAALALTPLVAGQATPPQAVFRSTADLVEIDVVVTDSRGEPVRGITQQQFQVSDRGRPQPIALFEEISRDASPAQDRRDPAALATTIRDVADNRTSRAQRLVVLVVDDLHIYRGRTDAARALAKDIITKIGAGASMALLLTSGERGTPVTEDPARLLAAADTIKGRQTFRRPHPAVDVQGVKGLDPEMDPDLRLRKLEQAGQDQLQDFQDNLTSLKALQNAARLAGTNDSRHKVFILMSEGFGKDLTGVFDGTSTPCDLMTPGSPCYHDHALRAMMDAMQRANVTTYAVDPRGHVPSQDLMKENFPPPGGLLATRDSTPDKEDSPFVLSNPVRQAQSGLGFLAEASGGFAITNTDDFAAGIDRIASELDHSYLLGFYPSDPAGSGFRPLDVRVIGHPEWTLRFRKGYLPGGPDPLASKADPLLSGLLPKTDLRMRLAALALSRAPGGTKSTRMGVLVEVTSPTAALAGADGMLRDDVTYQVAAIDLQHGRVPVHAGRVARLSLKPAGAGAPPDSVTYQIDTSIDLTPGSYQLRVSAASQKAALGGSVYVSVDVPDLSSGPLTLSGLAVGYASGPRVPVAPSSAAGGALTASDLGVPFAPSLDRVFSARDVLRVWCQLGQDPQNSPVRGAVALVGQDGRAVLTIERPPGGPLGRGFDFELPLARIEPGPYRLRVSATSGRATATREISIAIRP